MLDNEDKLKRLVKGLWVIGIIFSIGQVIQSFFGILIFGQGVVGVVKTVGQVYAGLYRSQSSGITFSIFAFYMVVTGYLLKTNNATKMLPLTFLFVMAILTSFGRGIWATTLLGIGTMSLSLGFKKGIKLIGSFSIMLVIGIGIVGVIKPQSVLALKDRALSASDDAEHGSSLNWRFYENKMAMIKLTQYPILGIGLGTAYRPPAISDVAPEQVRYVHNGFLYMTLKLGPLSLIALAWIVIAFFRLARNLLRAKLPTKHKTVVIASIALFTQLLVLSITQPEFLMMSWGIGVLAALIGILGAMKSLLESGGLDMTAR
jgi:O-antigen ligase